MLWQTNVLTEGSGRTLVADDVWGVELVDQSLATAWYPADWDSVTDDELVFLLPSLSNWAPVHDDRHEPAQCGPIDYLTRTLTARADAAARLIVRKSGRTDPAAAAEIADHLVSSGLLSSIQAHRHSNDSTEPAPDHGQNRLPNWLIAELIALAYTDRMLSDAMGKAEPRDGARAPIIDWPLSLADVVVASISARVNGAYVYPEQSYAHELLALGAVLGHLIEGRAAYLPPSLAEALLDVLSARRSPDDEASVVLRTYIELAGGANRLMLWARIIAATGVPRCIAPRAVRVPPVRAAWNARLLQRLEAQTLWHAETPPTIDSRT